MRILFIGGTGNISTDCASVLHARGHEILVLTRGRTAVPPHYTTIQGDYKNPITLRHLFEKLDIVLNFLGYEVADVQRDFDLFRHVQQYIFISSATVYRKPPVSLPITETHPLGNRWWDYAQKKLMCEDFLRDRSADAGFPVTIVRPSHTYSKKWVPNPVSSSSYTFAARLESGKPVFIPDDGETRWTMTAASDFAIALAGLIGNRATIGEAFHITSDEVLTWNQIYAEIASALGISAPQIIKIPTDFICDLAPNLTGNLKGDKSHPAVFDNTKVKNIVSGFKAQKPFSVGIRESIAWLRTHPQEKHLSPEVDVTFDKVITGWQMKS
jgi:nucleoside-diphosphate-sugar epimerase